MNRKLVLQQKKINIFSEKQSVFHACAERIYQVIDSTSRQVNIALAGGNTPRPLYLSLAQDYRESIPWIRVHFYWADERCVPSDHEESNYKMAWETLLKPLHVPLENIHRIQGESDPEKEAKRYTSLIMSYMPKENDLPCFDLILLGMGADGHFASIFSQEHHLYEGPELCAVTRHPQNRRQRITLTLPVINNARLILFLVTGREKAKTLASIFSSNKNTPFFPASCVKSIRGETEWYLDTEAASELSI